MKNKIPTPHLIQIINSRKLSCNAKKNILQKSGIKLSEYLNQINPEGYTLLGEMCRLSNQEVTIEWLIQQGANLEQGRSSSGQTPLGIAAQHGEIAAMQLLLEHDASPNGCNTASLKKKLSQTEGEVHLGKPPIYWAIRYGQVEAVELLVAFGALESLHTSANLELFSLYKDPLPLAYARELLRVTQLTKKTKKHVALFGEESYSIQPTKNKLLKMIMVLKSTEIQLEHSLHYIHTKLSTMRSAYLE